MHISDISAKRGERHLIAGTTGSGKSALQQWETMTIADERPDAMQVILDTKPRYRAETERMPFNYKGRRSAAWRYTSWDKSPVLPNSVVADLNTPHPFRGLWTRPGEIVILQSGDAADWNRMLILMTAFVKAHIKGRERRIIVDEILDFYGRNTYSINTKYDEFYHAARAGRERGVGMSMGAQRLKGIPPLIIAMLSRLTLFHLALDSDMKYLSELGIDDENSPSGNFVFRHYMKEPGGVISEPIHGRCTYPQSFLEQLAVSS
jgi:energy-coupling factor transporter ATP-binding protein EcfA2